MAATVPFRFDVHSHTYVALDTGEELPHITGMLERAGLIDDTWFTEESCERGHQVHRLCADYDLGAIAREDVPLTRSGYAAWLQTHVKAMDVIRPQILAVEEPAVHPVYRFGGRIDRRAVIYGLRSVLEIKSGAAHHAHQIQTALQAILDAPAAGLPPEAIARFALYLKPGRAGKPGKWVLEKHDRRRDFDEAQRIIRQCCGR